jgi:hypothetical protein
MYRPASGPTLSGTFFGEKNCQTLYTVLSQDFQEKQRLEPAQLERLSKTISHYQQEVFQKWGDGSKPLPVLNREVLVACSKDFTHYLQRKDASRGRSATGVGAVQQVMDESMFQDTTQRLERINKERQGVKALPPPAPDFRISLSEDGPPAAELYERAKRAREQEALRSSALVVAADTGLQQRIQADSQFRQQQNSQNRASEELALVQRNPVVYPSAMDKSLVVPPDRRDMFLVPVGAFDGMTQGQGQGQGQNQAAGNSTLALPVPNAVAVEESRLLPQSVVTKEESVVHYREVENNLFIYSADRDWLRNNKENRYQFTVQFDPAANGQSFGAFIWLPNRSSRTSSALNSSRPFFLARISMLRFNVLVVLLRQARAFKTTSLVYPM